MERQQTASTAEEAQDLSRLSPGERVCVTEGFQEDYMPTISLYIWDWVMCKKLQLL